MKRERGKGEGDGPDLKPQAVVLCDFVRGACSPTTLVILTDSLRPHLVPRLALAGTAGLVLQIRGEGCFGPVQVSRPGGSSVLALSLRSARGGCARIFACRSKGKEKGLDSGEGA